MSSQRENPDSILEELFENIYIFDKEWRFYYLNAAAEEFWGRPREELLGQVIWDSFPYNVDSIFYQEYHRAMTERCKIKFEGFSTIHQKWIEVKVTPVSVGLAICAQDITHRKRIEFQYQDEVRKLSQLIENCPFPIIVTDRKGIVQLLNKAVFSYDFISYSEQQALGMPLWKLIPTGGDYRDTEVFKALEGVESRDRYFQIGQCEWLLNAFPLRDTDSGEITGAIAFYHNITDYERLRKELLRLDRLNLVGELAAGVAHEIRNPLTVIKGYLQHLQRKSSAEHKIQLRLVLEELARVEAIINDFLSLTKEKLSAPDRHNLGEIILSVVPLIVSDISEHGIEPRIEIADVPDALFEKKEIKQLVLNLVRNSIEAMGNQDQGRLTVQVGAAGDRVYLNVADTGPGIPQEHLDKIYDPFFTTKEYGTGLGLSLCASIVKRHGGTMEVITSPQGTQFTAHFPVLTGPGGHPLCGATRV